MTYRVWGFQLELPSHLVQNNECHGDDDDDDDDGVDDDDDGDDDDGLGMGNFGLGG